MKLTHYLKSYSFYDKKKLALLTSGMNYDYKLKLLSLITQDHLPPEKYPLRVVRDLLKPLSDEKRIKVILGSKNRWEHLGRIENTVAAYTSAVKKQARKNKIKSLADLVNLNSILIKMENKIPFEYSNKWSSYLELDGLSFTAGKDIYNFYIPKNKGDFLEAGIALQTCVGSYSSGHMKRFFKFFVKKNGQFFSSVQFLSKKRNGHQGCLVFYSYNNSQLSAELVAAINRSLKPFFKNLDKITYDNTNVPSSSSSATKQEVYKEYFFSKSPLKLHYILPRYLIHEGQGDKTVTYFSASFLKGKKVEQTITKFYQGQWYEIITRENAKNLVINLPGLDSVEDTGIIKALLEGENVNNGFLHSKSA